MIRLVNNGMKLQKCMPGFLDARDAIIQADQVLTGGENYCLLWEGFADRGLGPDARVDGRTPWGGGIRTDVRCCSLIVVLNDTNRYMSNRTSRRTRSVPLRSQSQNLRLIPYLVTAMMTTMTTVMMTISLGHGCTNYTRAAAYSAYSNVITSPVSL